MNITPPLSVFDNSPSSDIPTPPSYGLRHRSTSSDCLLRQPKRRRSNNHVSPQPSLTTSPEEWTPEDGQRYVTQPASATLHPFLDTLEQSVAWGALQSSSSAATSSFLKASHLPTPSTTLHSSFSSTHITPERASTLPNTTSLTAKALAIASGLQQREVRAGGAVEVDGPPATLEAGLPSRSQTDPGLRSDPSSKDRFVAGLVGASVIAIESIWGPAPVVDDSTSASTDSSVLPLQWFVREVLRRSRTSCSTLQVSLYYLHKCRREIRETVARAEAGTAAAIEEQSRKIMRSYEMDAYPSPPHTPVDLANDRDRFADQIADVQANPVLCGRRMFLASLIAASKFLQDRNYSNRAWAKISGLPVQEINDNERVFLGLMKFQLHLGAEDFQKWTERLAALASQGAALENATATNSSPLRNRLGLARHATEYLAAPPLHDIGAASSSSCRNNSNLGRTYSDPEMATRMTKPEAYLSSSAVQINLPALPRKPSSTLRIATPASTPVASPAPTDASSDSSIDAEPSPRFAMPENHQIQGRRVLRLPIGRFAPKSPVVGLGLHHRPMDVCGQQGFGAGGFAATGVSVRVV